MSKEDNVIRFYVLCSSLKNVIRTGWKEWRVQRERLESVAEHIYGAQVLAIAIKSEYDYNVDLYKVILMLAIHELEEIYIGDLTQFQIQKEDKKIIGHQAVEKVLGCLMEKETIKNIILEFDERKTPEALFCHYCDKLECDLQSKLYGEEDLVDLNNQSDNKTMQNETVQRLLKDGNSWSEMWLLFGQEKYNYDEHFLEISNYALKNNIGINFEEETKEFTESIKKILKKNN